jgi:hypothetical protein
MSAMRLERAVTRWLREQIAAKGDEILDGQVTAEKFNERKAYRQALKDVLAKLPELAKKEGD